MVANSRTATSNNSDAQYLLYGAHNAFESALEGSGNTELADTLREAKVGYAKKMAMESFNEQIDKHMQPMQEGSFLNYATFNNAMKNWITNDGLATVEFNPEIRQALNNFRAVTRAHPELKTLIQNPDNTGFLKDLFGKTPMDFAFKHAGAAIGAGVGGPLGAAAGEAT